MVRDLIFNGIHSRDLGLVISSSKSYNSAQRSYSSEKIAGKNGELVTYDGSFQNVEIPYTLMWTKSIEETTRAVKSWLLKPKGYCRLENDYQQDYFRLAMVSGSLDFDTFKNKSGSVEVTFNCKPQLFYKTGETSIEFTKDGTLHNPSEFEAKPIIRVYGVGSFEIGSETITVASGATSYIDIDCDIQDCYEGLENRNELVTLTDFPTLESGDTGVKLGTGITKLEIIPRWWTI